MHHSQRLAPEGVNLSHRLMRIQARPKILLCRTFEEAWACFSAYRENVLGVISDIEFPLDGARRGRRRRRVRAPRARRAARRAGRAAVERAGERGAGRVGRARRSCQKDSPVLLQRAAPLHGRATSASATSSSGCPTAPRSGARTTSGRSRSCCATVPAESIAYHAERNHFSKWLKARTEFALAHHLRPRKVSDFADARGPAARPASQSIRAYREQRAAVDRRRLRAARRSTPRSLFTRIGSGSLGGKARGLAFVNLLLDEYDVAPRGSRTSRSPCRPRPSWPPTSSTASSTRTTCATSRSSATTTRRSSAGSWRRRCPPTSARDLASFLELVRLPARGPLVEPARGLAVPAVRRHLRHLHAAERPPRPGGAARAAAGGDQARLRLHLLAAREGLPRRDALPPRGGEDGGHPPEAGRQPARRPLLPDFAGVARSHNFYPVPPMARGGRHGRRGARPRRDRRGRRAVPPVLPALSRSTCCSSRR